MCGCGNSRAWRLLAAARAVAGLRFSYVGRTQLAKQYGSLALYHMRRRVVVK